MTAFAVAVTDWFIIQDMAYRVVAYVVMAYRRCLGRRVLWNEFDLLLAGAICSTQRRVCGVHTHTHTHADNAKLCTDVRARMFSDKCAVSRIAVITRCRIKAITV